MEFTNDLLAGAEEESRTLPADTRYHKGYTNAVTPLAGRIANLASGKCIRISKAVNPILVQSLRYVLAHNFGFRLVVRTKPGETYFWRGEKLAGIKEQ